MPQMPPRSPGPDWVMIGLPRSDGVVVLASTELTEAELASERLDDYYPPPYHLSSPRPVEWRHRLTVEMRAYVEVHAPTYAEAFTTLFAQWQPTTSRQPEIEPATRSLEPSP